MEFIWQLWQLGTDYAAIDRLINILYILSHSRIFLMNYHLLLITQTDLNIYYCSLFLYDVYLDITFYICILLDNGPQHIKQKTKC